MSVSINQEIFRLQISVYDILAVHMAKCKQNFTYIEHGYIITKASIFAEPIKKLTSRAILENHVDKAVILKGSFEGIDEGVVEFHEDLFFHFDMINLFETDNMTFRELLQSQDLFIGGDNLFDSAECSCTKSLNKLIF